MKGRPTKFGSRMKSNGLTVEMDKWLRDEASRRNVSFTEIKRIAFVAFRAAVEVENNKIIQGDE